MVDSFFKCLAHLLKKLPYNLQVKILQNGGVIAFISELHFEIGSQDFSRTIWPILFGGLL